MRTWQPNILGVQSFCAENSSTPAFTILCRTCAPNLSLNPDCLRQPVSLAVRCSHENGRVLQSTAAGNRRSHVTGYFKNKSCLRKLRKNFRINPLWKPTGRSAASYHCMPAWELKILGVQAFRAEKSSAPAFTILCRTCAPNLSLNPDLPTASRLAVPLGACTKKGCIVQPLQETAAVYSSQVTCKTEAVCACYERL